MTIPAPPRAARPARRRSRSGTGSSQPFLGAGDAEREQAEHWGHCQTCSTNIWWESIGYHSRTANVAAAMPAARPARKVAARTGRGTGRADDAPNGGPRGKNQQGEDEPQRPGIELLQLDPEEPGEGPAAPVAHPSYDREDDEQEGQEGRAEPDEAVAQEARGPLRARPADKQPGDEEEQPHREHGPDAT